MAVRRVLAVIVCLLVGSSLGGVQHARGNGDPVRTCEEVEEDYAECDDDTVCIMHNGVWVCTPN